MAEPGLIAARWVRSPDRARTTVRSASAIRERAADEHVPLHELIDAAGRAAWFGRYELAADLYDRAINASDDTRAIVLARRRLPGYSGEVASETVRRAIEAAFGSTRNGGQPIIERRVRPLTTGKGADVDVVVRHDLTNGRTMVRKSLLGDAPRELLAYESGFLATGDQWWRAPDLYFAARDGADGWHLFFEDVAPIARPRTATAMITAARALGQMNGAHVGDPGLGTRWPWIADSGRSLRFARPRWADARLKDVVDDDVRRRVRRTLAVLVSHEAMLSDAQAELPRTFMHGDAVPSNVSVGRERVVLFDWNACGRGPVGTELGYLLCVPGAALDPTVVERCRQAYQDGLASVASQLPTAAEVELGYRYRFVTLSLRLQLALLPSTPRPSGRVARVRDLAILTWSGRRRSRVEANLTRICDEAEALLALVR